MLPDAKFVPIRVIARYEQTLPRVSENTTGDLPMKVQEALAKYLKRARNCYMESNAMVRSTRKILRPIRTLGQLHMVCPVLLTLTEGYQREVWRTYKGKPAFPAGAMQSTGELLATFKKENLDLFSAKLNATMMLPKFEPPDDAVERPLNIQWDRDSPPREIWQLPLHT